MLSLALMVNKNFTQKQFCLKYLLFSVTLLKISYTRVFVYAGTAGVWRIAAMEEAGGWKDRTTVEDTDLAVRVGLLGWKFVFINDVEVLYFFSFNLYCCNIFTGISFNFYFFYFNAFA